MKSRIEELACYVTTGQMDTRIAFITAVNEALELAAKECDNVLMYNEDDPGETFAEAIRKLKCS